MDYMNPNEFQKFAVKHQGINSMVMHDYQNAFNSGIYNLTPNIIEERQLNVVAMDVFSRPMMDRIIFLGMGINDQGLSLVLSFG
mgnify:FL=1